MKVFYARVSLETSDLQNQLLELRTKWGDHEVHTDKISAVKVRPSLDHLLNTLPKGSTIYAVGLDRFSRDMSDAFSIMQKAKDRKISLVTVREGDLLAQNQMMFAIQAYVAQEERNKISQRTVAGIEKQRQKYDGKWGGQLNVNRGKRAVYGPTRMDMAKPFMEELRRKGNFYDQIATLATKEFGIAFSKTRVYGMLNPSHA